MRPRSTCCGRRRGSPGGPCRYGWGRGGGPSVCSGLGVGSVLAARLFVRRGLQAGNGRAGYHLDRHRGLVGRGDCRCLVALDGGQIGRLLRYRCRGRAVRRGATSRKDYTEKEQENESRSACSQPQLPAFPREPWPVRHRTRLNSKLPVAPGRSHIHVTA